MSTILLEDEELSERALIDEVGERRQSNLIGSREMRELGHGH